MTVGDFMIDLGSVPRVWLNNLRRYLPQNEYKVLKNRKSARLCRQRRKEEHKNLQKQAKNVQNTVQRLLSENTAYRVKLKEKDDLIMTLQ